jgi:hypothetical protein
MEPRYSNERERQKSRMKKRKRNAAGRQAAHQ